MSSAPAAVRDEAAIQKAADCLKLAPSEIPDNAQAELIKPLPQPAQGELEDAYRARLTPAQRAALDWFNQAAGDAVFHVAYCRPKGDP